MASTYRCYLLDYDRVVSMEELECENDSAALLEVSRILTISPFTAAEIWEGGRKVSIVSRRSPEIARPGAIL